MKRLCIIPARGGSKRLPGKNFRNLNGFQLLYQTYSIVCTFFDHVIISTDAPDLIDFPIYKKDKIDTDFKHSDTTKVIEAVRFYFFLYGLDYDQIWCALPTCPLRTKEDVRGAMGLLTKKIDKVVSITDYEFSPMLGLLQSDKGYIYDWLDTEPYKKDNTRSQDQMVIHRPNGALYGAWCKSFEKSQNFFTGKVKGYYMPRERSVDIDTELDLKVAEAVLNERS